MNNIDTYLTNAHSDDFATEAEERATLNTFADEPKDNLTPEQAFDILFGYAEERHNSDPLAHTKNLKPIL